MNKDEIEEKILKTTFEYDGFVCGGYVRDKIIAKEPYKDIDVFIWPDKRVHFINRLAMELKCTIIPNTNFQKKDKNGENHVGPYFDNIKILADNVVVDILGTKPYPEDWDFDINCLKLVKDGIKPLFDINCYIVTGVSDPAPRIPMDVLTITSNIISKRAVILGPVSTMPQYRIDKFESKGYDIIVHPKFKKFDEIEEQFPDTTEERILCGRP